MTLTQFLMARLDEDAVAAQRAHDEASDYQVKGSYLAEDHFARWKPDRVLADVDAKRRIVAEHSPHHHGACPVCWRVMTRSSIRQYFPCLTLRLLALPFTDHPDYREEWQLRSPGA